MSSSGRQDAVVVGAGPNGLAAAIALADAGLSVELIEASTQVGGGLSSAELTEPGFTHDLCSAIHPFAAASPYLTSLDLERYGLEWVQPTLPYAHPLDGGDAAAAHVDVHETAQNLGEGGDSWRRLYEPMLENSEELLRDVLQPVLHVPRHPLLLARFGIPALSSAHLLGSTLLRGERARALFAGIAGHSLISLKSPGSSAIALMLGIAGHVVGWPFPRGGAQSLADALAARFQSSGGKITTGRRIARIDEIDARIMLLDVTPRQFIAMAGSRLPTSYRARLERFKYGPGVFKLDYALSDPVPWTADVCRSAGTVHVGGTMEEISVSESIVSAGGIPTAPYVLTAQHSLFDETRAPDGRHTFWAYCHVPNGSTIDMTDRIEAQIEQFAPGFRDTIIRRHAQGPNDLERRNENLVGGDVNGGAATFWQLFARPVLRPAPYRTPLKGVYLCSASTPPGGGVHGMCGYNAARVALKDIGAARS